MRRSSRIDVSLPGSIMTSPSSSRVLQQHRWKISFIHAEGCCPRIRLLVIAVGRKEIEITGTSHAQCYRQGGREKRPGYALSCSLRGRHGAGPLTAGKVIQTEERRGEGEDAAVRKSVDFNMCLQARESYAGLIRSWVQARSYLVFVCVFTHFLAPPLTEIL